MSVLTHLEQRASEAILTSSQKESINRSIGAIKNRASTYFDNAIKAQIQFGSSMRGTILPRSMDGHSDIDYMLLFTDSSYQPQTYLDKLRRFVENYYPISEISQSSPTIVLELNHIRFELVPAINHWWSGLSIPAPDTSYRNWIGTDPKGFNDELERKNKRNNSLIKPAIRLVKYWNAQNDYVFKSYSLEQWIVGLGFWNESNLKDYIFSIFDRLNISSDSARWQKDSVKKAKNIIATVKEYERNGKLKEAEAEIKKLLP